VRYLKKKRTQLQTAPSAPKANCSGLSDVKKCKHHDQETELEEHEEVREEEQQGPQEEEVAVPEDLL
jgi:hypothetical protein